MKNNFGSAVVEATLIIPIFLFSMLALYSMCRCKLAEGIIYEAAAETAEYMAEYSYLDEPNLLIPGMIMPQYIDNEELVNESVKGGIHGIDYIGTITRDCNDYVVLKVNYTLNIDIPMMPSLSKKRHIIIMQRAYIGEGDDNGKNECSDEDKYVYVTDNKEVYHSSRSCTHLKLSIHRTNIKYAQNYGFSPCEFCGDKAKDIVYITDAGAKYHSNKECSGLKRTVYAVKLSEVKGLPGCSRCTQ
ncbi:MAG: pilus assembly protein [Lachnospiraceae bacterium]|nr:pilus assembly protein [Lachnospiraceae bacterium]